MTALQDWLITSPLNPRTAPGTVKELICAPLRGIGVLPGRRAAAPEGPRLLRPGLERC